MRVELIDSDDAFFSREEVWNKLLCRSAQDSIFLTHDWLATWWQVFGTGHQLYILAVFDDDSHELAGLLPTYVKAGFGYPVTRTLRFLGSEYVGSDFLDCILQRGREIDVIDTLLAYLGSRKNDWDVLVLSDIEATSLFLAEALRSPVFRNRLKDAEAVKCPYLDLPNEWDSLTRRVSGKQRSKIGYYRRALERKGSVEIESVEDFEAIDGAIIDLFRIRTARMEQKKNKIHFKTDKHFLFHNRICAKFKGQGWLRLKFLKVDHERVAFAYQFIFNNRTYFYQTGFDPAWFKQSVGFVLLGYEMQSAIESGCSTFEFLRGEEPYKFEWGETGVRELGSVYLYNHTAPAYLRYTARKALTGLKRLVKQGLKAVKGSHPV